MNKDGVIKFNCQWINQELNDFELFDSINGWRNCLREINLIGVNDLGIGFGNISIRHHNTRFIITGSGTGYLTMLSKQHYTVVTAWNFEDNTITAQGPIIASSESLTHAVIYEIDDNANAVIHIHHAGLWQQYLNILPTSDPSIEYGTPALASEIKQLFVTTDLSVRKTLIMGGHRDGILAFGNSLAEAGHIILNYLHNQPYL